MRCSVSRSISCREMVSYTQAVVSYAMESMMRSMKGSVVRNMVGAMVGGVH